MSKREFDYKVIVTRDGRKVQAGFVKAEHRLQAMARARQQGYKNIAAVEPYNSRETVFL